MRSVFFRRHGGPEVLELGDTPTPVPGAKDVLVRVRACGVNHGLDGRVRRDGGGRKIELPHILGAEIAGEVAALGAAVSGIKLGDPVVVAPWITCGSCEACIRGRDNDCDRFTMIGVDRPGGYAEYVAVPDRNIMKIPAHSSLTFDNAATLPVGFVTAWHMIAVRARLSAGETILILGAAGIVGIAAVQLAKLVGARVIAAAGSEAKRAFLKQLGADETIDYVEGDFSTKVMDLTGGKGADVIIDHVGEATWQKTQMAVARGGRVAVCGATTGFDLGVNARHLWRRNVSLHFSNSGTRGDLDDVIRFAANGQIRPVIADRLPLEQARDAHQRLADRALIGKLVLNP